MTSAGNRRTELALVDAPNNKSTMNPEISFFKFITSSEKMGIPQKSLACMRGIVRKKLTLRDMDGKVWSVKVERDEDEDEDEDEDGFSFKTGWPQFYQENSLVPGDMLVFTCTSVNSFDFRLLRHNGCDTDTRRASISILPFTRVKEEVVEVEEEEGDEEEYVVDKADNRKPDWYGHEIFNSGLAIRPNNPYFVSRARTGRKNELYIPRDVVVDFNLEIPARLTLFDASGRKWVSTVKKWRDGRLWCTRGWKSLCNINNIGGDDTCICEFVNRPQLGLCMLVHLVANGEPRNN